jgi:hypothetical protein
MRFAIEPHRGIGPISRDWHRLFGLLLTDFFSGSPFEVEIERDLSCSSNCWTW